MAFAQTMNNSRINLLEQRFGSCGKSSTRAVGLLEPDGRFGGPCETDIRADVSIGWNFDFTEMTVTSGVRQLANDLWKDAQIFGPHQRREVQTEAASHTAGKQGKKAESFNSDLKRTISRTAELFSELTDKQQLRLDELAALYTSSLDKNLCDNVLDEVQLWFQLLVESYDSSLSTFAPQDQVFGTASRRVYFVTKVLELQMTNVLMYIDYQVIQVLCKQFPHRIPKSIRKMLEKVVAIQQESRRKLDEITSPVPVSKSKDERVVFQSETEGRSNFLNNSDFHAFCKQRDIFYNIRDSWSATTSETVDFSTKPQSSHFGHGARQPHREQNDSQSTPTGYGKRVALKSPYSPGPVEPSPFQRMNQLLQLNTSPSNLTYLATLCLSQCLLDHANYKSTGGIEMADENLRHMYSMNPSKFKQLENRFPSAKSSLNDPLSFFKYFTDLASCPELNQHLIDRCVYEITEIEKQATNQEVRHWKDVWLNLNKARHLAQILGYLYFKPYQSFRSHGGASTIRSIEYEAYIQKQIRLRSYRPLPLDLPEILHSCVIQKRLIFTLPWVIEFLVQADPVSYHLPCFRKTFQLIVQMYRHLLVASSNFLHYFTKSGITFLRYFCGRLFKCPDFPTSLIYSPDLKLDCRIKQFLMNLTYGAVDMNSSIIEPADTDDDELVVDSLSTLADVLVYSSFENRMSSFRTLLSSCSKVSSTSNSSLVNIVPVKHIKPIPLNSTSRSEEDQGELSLQLKLETSFFNNHPPSVKRTVDFVLERMTSNFVKSLKSNDFPNFRDELVNSGIFEQDAVRPCQEKVIQSFKNVYSSKLETALHLLLSDSVSECVLLACKRICLHKSAEKIQEWASTHINKDLFPKVPLSKLSPCKPLRSKEAEVQVPPQFQSLSALQKIHQNIYRKRMLDTNALKELLSSDTLGNTPIVQSLTFDMTLAIITFLPQQFDADLQEVFFSFWHKVWKSPVKVICPRNVYLFQQSSSLDATWTKLACLISSMLEHNILTFHDIEEECLAFLRCDWPRDVMLRLSNFSQTILAKNTQGKSDETEVIDWVAWACSDDPGF